MAIDLEHVALFFSGALVAGIKSGVAFVIQLRMLAPKIRGVNVSFKDEDKK